MQLDFKNFVKMLRNMLAVSFLCLSICTVLFFALVLLWGENQDITPDQLLELRKSMPTFECATILNLPESALEPMGVYRTVNVARPGVGVLFVAQYKVDLEFDKDDRLVKVDAERGYKSGEKRIDITLTEPTVK